MTVLEGDLDDDRIRRLFVDSGCTAAEIAAELDCGISTICARVTALGVPKRPPAPRSGARPENQVLRRH